MLASHALSPAQALADEVRAWVELVATNAFSDGEADRARARLASLRADVTATPVAHERGGTVPRWPTERSVVSGPLNPVAPPLVVDVDGEDGVEGVVTHGRAYQGPPEHAHGGHVAMIFDHLAGRVASRGGRPVVTGKLTVRYHAPTPIARPIRYRARLRDARHSLLTVDCEAFAGSVRTASAEVMFVELGPSHFRHALGFTPEGVKGGE